MKVEFDSDALGELAEAAAYYEAQRSALAQAFRGAIDNAIKSIREAPARYPLTDYGCRKLTIRRFPYRIIYFQEADTVTILAVAHHSRRADYWQERLEEP